MTKVLRYAVLACIAFAIVAIPAFADPPSPDNTAGRSNDILGIVPSKDASHTAGAGGNLVFHRGGSVMHSNTTYSIYWEPSGSTVSSTYHSLIDGFLSNVAADSGKTTNVYYSDAQYTDAGGSAAYSSSFGGSVVDTNPYPANGCTDSYTSICLSDTQLRSEIDRVVAANGWPRGLGTLYFIFTPKGVGSCYSSSSCAFSSYCAYHSHFGSGTSTTLYANQPYTDTVPNACGTGLTPNGDQAADSTINVVSHEHNEAITDGLGNAWYDRRGYENGDKCAWNFGAAGGGYNQAINGSHYYLQQEWSNKSSGCVLTGQ